MIRRMVRACFCAPLVLLLATAALAAPPSPAPVQHRMYVCLDKCVGVFDMDDGHRLLAKLPVVGDEVDPGDPKGVRGPGNFAGICASAPLGRLYVSTTLTDELVCIDLKTGRILWHRTYGKRVDSPAITPDGRTIYLPCRDDGHWYVIDAASGDRRASIETGGNPHNTRVSTDGTRVYMSSLSSRDLFVADTTTNKLMEPIGPFSNIIRPFSLSNDGRHVFCCVNGLLGFEVGDTASGKVIARVEAHTPSARLEELKGVGIPHGVPSHGVGARPGSAEVWVADGAYGYVDVYDAASIPPRHVAQIPIFDADRPRPEPTWISFSLDGRYCYTPGDAIIDAQQKRLAGRMPTSEKMIEIDFEGGRPVIAAPRTW